MTDGIRWTNNPRQSGDGQRGKYAPMLAAIKADQPLHPGQWAELAKFVSPDTAKDTAYRLRKRWPLFQFRSGKDPESGYGHVYARYTGVSE